MGRFFVQVSIFIGIFLLMWWGLSSIPWVDTFHIQKFTREKQEQLSELVLKLHKMEKREIENPGIIQKVNLIKYAICKANRIDTAAIKIHVFDDKVINAFALPGGHIVVNTELINLCDNADMLAGVMSHEIAHVQLDHVSRKLTREIGVGTLLVLTGGAEHMGILKEILHTLSSRGFDRDMEREADRRAVMYMKKAKGDPEQLAYFLEKLADTYAGMPEALQWVSTHPETKERVEAILKNTANTTSAGGIIDNEVWEELKSSVAAIDSYKGN